MSGMGASRRTFLQSIVAGAASTTLPTFASAAGQPSPPHAAPPASLLAQVNLLQGTRSTYLFSRGNTLPIVAVPFGMAHWSLQSNSTGPWFFQPDDRRIEGIRCTHQLSPWLEDYGHATFMPVGPGGDAAPESRASSFRPEQSTLSPAYTAVRLLRYRAGLELAPTVRGAMLRVVFDDLAGQGAEKEPGLAIDLPANTSGPAPEVSLDAVAGLLQCSTAASAGGTPKNFRTYYAVQFGEQGARPALRLERSAVTATRTTVVVRFRAAPGVPMPIRIATSFISAEQTMHNLALELQPYSFDQVRAQAETVWNEHLGRIRVESATAAQGRTLYSAMYRALLFPRTFHELDRAGKPIHFSAFNGRVEPGVMYADHGYWDVYRAWYPWMSILFPDRLGEILQGWVNAAKEGGWLPQFPAPGYRACMTGSLIDAVFADAAVKRVPGFSLPDAYAALKKHATTPGDPSHGFGRRGLESYLKLGYVAEDQVKQSAAETVDAAYGDFCIGQIATVLGHVDDAAMFLRRSGNWRHLFDRETGFFRGKNSDGQWLKPFDPIRWGSPYVEGSAWQHRWDVPQDVDGLFEAMGGKKKAVEHLQQMLAMPAAFDVGVYGEEIHEMSEMAAVDFGQYAHSNQPVHHVLYLFALAGRPDLTQFWVRRVCNELYSPDSYAGDEDTGSMAAWYLLSVCGFYQVTPGKPEYVLGAPLFPKLTLTLPAGKQLEIVAPGNRPETCYVTSISHNGQELAGVSLSHATLMEGGVLTFTMSATAAKARAQSGQV